MRDASNEVTDIDMNMSERHVGKNAAFAIDIMFAVWRRSRKKWRRESYRYSAQAETLFKKQLAALGL